MTAAILERVRNLLTLADGTTNPNEAAVAAAQAQKLMTKHQLTRADVSETDPRRVRQDEEPLFRQKKLKLWQLALANAIAQENACLNVMTTNEKGRNSIFIIGKEEDTAVVRALFLYLRKEIEHHVCVAKDIGFLWGDGERTNQFRLGAVVSIGIALHQARQQAADEHGGSTALVKLDRDSEEAQHWAIDNIPGLEMNVKKSFEVDENSRAFLAGRFVGNRIPLINPKTTLEEG